MDTDALFKLTVLTLYYFITLLYFFIISFSPVTPPVIIWQFFFCFTLLMSLVKVFFVLFCKCNYLMWLSINILKKKKKKERKKKQYLSSFVRLSWIRYLLVTKDTPWWSRGQWWWRLFKIIVIIIQQKFYIRGLQWGQIIVCRSLRAGC